MGNPTLLAIDQGTTSSRAILFSQAGEVLDIQQKELPLYYPQKGWVEQRPDDMWNDVRDCCTKMLNQAAQRPVAIGITNQRETTIVWDRKTGESVYNAIVWQDRRTAELCKVLKNQGHEPVIASKTGLLLDPYFSATKLVWILDNVPGVRARAEAGELAFGTVDCYLLWKLTGGAVHATDATNASRTMLYNIVEQQWDTALLALFNIPVSLLPEVKDNISAFGITDERVLGVAIPISGMAGDQQAALIGQGCLKPGMVKSTYGTGCFALMNIGAEFKQSKNRLLTTAAYRIDGKMTYAIEGSIFAAGAAIQWLRDGLGLFSHASESEALAISVKDSNEVYFVPAFTGLGAPYWCPHAKAMIMGLSRESTQAHIVRAALEAQAYQTLDLMGAMRADSEHDPDVIRADGGLVANKFICQFLADMLGFSIEVPKVTEAAAWGAAALAGVQVGVFSSVEEVAESWRAEKIYKPKMDVSQREKLYAGWGEAVAMLTKGGGDK
jgi:glycerol kinase|tara:strand:+ start:36227 stop:37717 length:1491 start_codon:yes stop_codon:yes gene_type:complete